MDIFELTLWNPDLSKNEICLALDSDGISIMIQSTQHKNSDEVHDAMIMEINKQQAKQIIGFLQACL